MLIATTAARAAEPPTDQLDPKAAALSDAYNRFGFGLFNRITKSASTQNVFISPASAAFALAMLYNGAAGTTREELAQVLGGLGELTLEEEGEANARLLEALSKGDTSVQLAVANSIWYRNSFKFREDFLDRSRESFMAEVAALNFDDPGAPAIINAWVDRSTRGKIGKMVDQIDPMDVMFLMNAVYFKGKWTHPFSKEQTANRPFHRLDGSVTELPMMGQTESFRYFATDSFQAIRLPYGSESCHMVLFLPSANHDLAGFVATLSPDRWAVWRDQFRYQDVHLVMPRFTLEYEIPLNEPLQAMGMTSAFDLEAADLSGLWDPPEVRSFNLYVSSVRQKTFVEVNEEGTEAAAVTSVGITASSVPPPPREMIVDRPFFFAIVDRTTDLILFMGAIVDPAP